MGQPANGHCGLGGATKCFSRAGCWPGAAGSCWITLGRAGSCYGRTIPPLGARKRISRIDRAPQGFEDSSAWIFAVQPVTRVVRCLPKAPSAAPFLHPL